MPTMRQLMQMKKADEFEDHISNTDTHVTAEKQAEWDKKQRELIATAESIDGVNYVATFDHTILEYYSSMEITIIPNITSNSLKPLLACNGLESKQIFFQFS